MDLFNLDKLDEELTKYGLSPIREGYLKFSEYSMPENFRHMEKQISEFEVFDDDVWVTSYPKCGTTWTQEIVWCMCNNFNFKAAENEDLDIRFPFLEYETCFYTEDLNLLKHEPGIVHKSVEIANNKPRPRFIKSHLPWELLPKQIQTFQKQPKIIHVTRNPKDTCVSYYHHSRLMEGFKGDFDLFWKLFITGKLNFSPMIQNILSYWNHKQNGNILFIRYEDMKADIKSTLVKISKFLGISMDEEQLEALDEHVRFDIMKTNASTQHGPVVDYLKYCGAMIDTEGSFMRSGIAGGYKSDMNEEVERIFDEWIAKELAGTGLVL